MTKKITETEARKFTIEDLHNRYAFPIEEQKAMAPMPHPVFQKHRLAVRIINRIWSFVQAEKISISLAEELTASVIEKHCIPAPEITPREKPCLCVNCKCGSVFFARVFSEKYPMDQDTLKELAEYAREGYIFSMKNADEFRVERCKCDKTKT